MAEQMKNEIEWPYHLIQAFYNVSYLGGLQDEIINMAQESFKDLKNGQHRSSVIVAGETLHRLNCALTTAFITVKGHSEHKKLGGLNLEDKGDYEIARILLHRFKLSDSITVLRDLSLINDELFLNMNILRHLRNESAHSRTPSIYSYELPLDMLGITIRDVLATPKGLEPLQWQRYQFIVKINNKDTIFTVDPEKLMIDLRDLEYEKFAPTISLAILFLSIKNMVNQMNYLFLLGKE